MRNSPYKLHSTLAALAALSAAAQAAPDDEHKHDLGVVVGVITGTPPEGIPGGYGPRVTVTLSFDSIRKELELHCPEVTSGVLTEKMKVFSVDEKEQGRWLKPSQYKGASSICCSNAGSSTCELALFKVGEDSVTLVISDPNANPNGKFGAAIYAKELLGSGPDEIRQDGVKWKDRFSTTVGSTLKRDDITLITHHTTGSGESEADSGHGTVVEASLGFLGFHNPFAKLLGERSHYDLTIDAKLSDNTKYNDGGVTIQALGTSSKFRLAKELVPFSGPTLSVSESLNKWDLYYKLGWRLGDHRMDTFAAEDEALCPIYVEFGTDLGTTFHRRYTNVPTPDRLTQGLFRPFVSVGIFKVGGPGSFASFTGKLTEYLCMGDVSGASDFRGWAPVFSFEAAMGPKNNKLILGISGGRSLTNGFDKVRPTYSLKYAVKY